MCRLKRILVVKVVLLFLFSLSLSLISGAQTSPDVGAALSLEKKLLDPETWKIDKFPWSWRVVSEANNNKTLELTKLEPVFGWLPQQVQAYYKNGALSEIQIVYLEAGNFYLKDEIKAFSAKEAKKAFEKRFSELENSLEKKLLDLFGPGRRVNVGKSKALRSRATEYQKDDLRVRLFAEDDQLISVSILQTTPTLTADSQQINPKGPQTSRRQSIESNVEKLPNGDVIIHNIPMVEQGDRGYCAIGTLTMLMRYYGLSVNVDLIAAKAGYREGDVRNATLQPIYAACAKESGLKFHTDDQFNFRKAKKLLLQGQPIIVFRKFDRQRDNFHSMFAEQFALDPTVRLPNPDRNERKRWTSFSSGHASLITGFNEQRKEVLFTESWSEHIRNRRMRIEEMEATATQVYYFAF